MLGWQVAIHALPGQQGQGEAQATVAEGEADYQSTHVSSLQVRMDKHSMSTSFAKGKG
jgi:hypothetical protein